MGGDLAAAEKSSRAVALVVVSGGCRGREPGGREGSTLRHSEPGNYASFGKKIF